jgi:hypothetical protein
MEFYNSNKNYIKLLRIDELHKDILSCISEMRFIKDEQQFLEDLIKNYTLELLNGTVYEKSKGIITDLAHLKKELTPLLKKSMNHSNNLEALLEEVIIPSEMEKYKEVHYKLLLDVATFIAKFKKSKRKIFSLIKQVMKKDKQTRLLA